MISIVYLIAEQEEDGDHHSSEYPSNEEDDSVDKDDFVVEAL